MGSRATLAHEKQRRCSFLCCLVRPAARFCWALPAQGGKPAIERCVQDSHGSSGGLSHHQGGEAAILAPDFKTLGRS